MCWYADTKLNTTVCRNHTANTGRSASRDDCTCKSNFIKAGPAGLFIVLLLLQIL